MRYQLSSQTSEICNNGLSNVINTNMKLFVMQGRTYSTMTSPAGIKSSASKNSLQYLMKLVKLVR